MLSDSEIYTLACSILEDVIAEVTKLFIAT